MADTVIDINSTIAKAKELEADALRGNSMAFIQAFRCYEQVLTNGDTKVPVMLQCFEAAEGCIKNAITAGVKCEPSPEAMLAAMKQKTAKAIYIIGFGYEDIQKDPQRAMELYKIAIEGGNSDAMVRMAGLSMKYYHSDDESLRYLSMAAKAGNSEAVKLCVKWGSDLYQNDETDLAFRYMKIAADAGDINAMYNIAMFYYNADEITECKKWLKKAADLGDRECAEKLQMLGGYTPEPVRYSAPTYSAPENSSPAPDTPSGAPALVFGILGLAFSYTVVLGIIFSALGLSRAAAYKKEAGTLAGAAKVGKVFSVIGLVLSILILVGFVAAGILVFLFEQNGITDLSQLFTK